jgi:hypothetical protein
LYIFEGQLEQNVEEKEEQRQRRISLKRKLSFVGGGGDRELIAPLPMLSATTPEPYMWAPGELQLGDHIDYRLLQGWVSAVVLPIQGNNIPVGLMSIYVPALNKSIIVPRVSVDVQPYQSHTAPQLTAVARGRGFYGAAARGAEQ